jgi:signal transduction histidine kinase
MVFGAGLDGTVLRVDEHGEWERNYRVLSLPLRAKDRVVGALAVASVRAEEPLGSRDLALMHAYAAQIAAAAENSQLIEVVREREAQLGDLVRKLVRAQDDERQRIARELHDETGQRLTALALGMAVLEGQMDAGDAGRARTLLQSLREVSDSALDELRNVMSNLRPAQLDDLGLVPALRWYVGQFAQRNPDMRVTLTADRQPERLSPERETALFRAAQESLSNVARHARADVVTVRLSHQGAIVRLEVIDNGAGFDPAMVRTHAEGSGLGLAGMRERVALVGGRCTIASEPGQGTLVVVEVPVAPEPRPTGGHSEES